METIPARHQFDDTEPAGRRPPDHRPLTAPVLYVPVVPADYWLPAEPFKLTGPDPAAELLLLCDTDPGVLAAVLADVIA